MMFKITSKEITLIVPQFCNCKFTYPFTNGFFAGVDFTDALQAAEVRADPKSTKRY